LKALVEEDKIIKLDSINGIEIGNPPAGVGFERLRWNGSNIVDLANLSEFWVRVKNNVFELHCVPVEGSQLVIMTYADRYKLIQNGGSIRVKTEQEIEDERIGRLLKLAKSKLSKKMGELIDLNMSMLAFICSLIVYARQQPQQLADFYDEIIPDIKDVFPMNRWETDLKQFGKDLKQFVNEYYDEIDNI
jgi:hypothetical protein